MATSVEATSKRMSMISNAMVRFLLKGLLRLSGFGDSGGGTTTGTREDGDDEAGDVVSAEACKGADAGSGGADAAFGGADAEAADVARGEACTEASDGFVATIVKADAALSERPSSSSEASGGVAGLPCPLLRDVADCGEDKTVDDSRSGNSVGSVERRSACPFMAFAEESG